MPSRHHCLLAILVATLLTGLVTGCRKSPPAPAGDTTAPSKHEHTAPHGGTPVVLGSEAYHLELVRDGGAGKLQAYVLDGELENFVRCNAPALEVEALVNGQPTRLVLGAVANSATGESVGDTALFEGQAEWLKTLTQFDATLKSITVRGTTFAEVKFNFPRGNDHD